jgi:hypothetical protein
VAHGLRLQIFVLTLVMTACGRSMLPLTRSIGAGADSTALQGGIPVETSIAIRLVQDTVRFFSDPGARWRPRDTVRAGPGLSWFTAIAVIRNNADRPVFRSLCGPQVQHKVEGEWLDISWSRGCDGGTAPILPKQSYVDTVAVVWETGSRHYGHLANPAMVPGHYRLEYGLGWSIGREISAGAISFLTWIEDPLPPEAMISPPFVVIPADAPE